MIIPEIIYNLSLLVALCVFSGFLDDRFDSQTRQGALLQGLLFGVIAIVAMAFPYTFQEGIFFDGRTIVVSLGTLFFGPLAGLITALSAGVFRFSLGGAGLTMGLLTIISAYLIGWAFHTYRRRRDSRELKKRELFLFGVMVHVVMLLTSFGLPGEIRSEVITNVILTIMVVYPIITMLIGRILQDQQQQKKQLHDLAASEERFRLLVESTDDVIFTMDTEMRHTGVFGSWVEKSGMTPEDFLGKTASDVLGPDTAQYHEKKYRLALKGEVIEYEWFVPVGKEKAFFQTRLSPIRKSGGEIIGLVGVGRNITELKRTQKELARSLREKTVLLSEIHHRVKNNMAIVSSLLTLQSDRQSDPELVEVLVDTEARVRSMALLHEIVYEQDNYAEIDMSELLQRLLQQLSRSYVTGRQSIRLDLDAEPILLDMTRSIPFTLLVNELVTNAFKHAFAGRDEGVISVCFHRVGDEYRLEVRDDGHGVANLAALRDPSSFGYTIIHGLARQLRGSIAFRSDGGGRDVEDHSRDTGQSRGLTVTLVF
ncbi:LytS/YhcK type 5TM receptor domain-containing protein [Balneolales bacterium ANBcel1]|nr:LytS/YhcK type 5TM receptor domain-containing protein [Balneolales bacterium ANBcel1]